MGGFGLAVNSMIQFLLPLRALELGIGIATIGLLLGAKGLVEALASVPIGSFIDRVGPRKAVLVGTAGAATLGLVYASTTSLVVLVGAQLALGFVRPLGWVGSQAYVSGMRTGADSAADTGRFSFVANGGQVVAPLLVGYVAGMRDLSAAFLAFAVYCAGFAIVAALLPERAPPAAPAAEGSRHSFGAAARMLRLRPMRNAMLLTFTRLWISSTWIAFFPLFLVTNGVDESAAATVVSAMALVATGTGLVVGRLARYVEDFKLTAVGLGIGCVGVAVAPFVGGLPAAYLSSALVGLALGISLPMLIVLVRAAAPQGLKATALGLRISVNQTAAAVAPVAVAGLLGATTATVGFPLSAAVALTFIGSAGFGARPGLTRPRRP